MSDEELFSGEWLLNADGKHVKAYPGEYISSWSGGVEFAVDRAVMHEIIEDQAQVYPAGVDLFKSGANRLEWLSSDSVLLTNFNAADVQVYDMRADGTFEVGYGWTWYRVQPQDVAGFMEEDERKAHELQKALVRRGVYNRVHWDRSPWGVAIPLTSDRSEGAPHLYVLTELEPVHTRSDGVPWGVQWHGSIGGYEEHGTWVADDISFDIIERPGESETEVAERVDHILQLIVPGARVLAQEGAPITMR